MEQPKPESIRKMWSYAEKFATTSGTSLHPQREVTEAVVLGLAANIDRVGRPVCPCNFYPEKDADGSWPAGLYLPREEEAKRRTWICPADHEGREIYGLVRDPTPDKGRALGRVQ